MARIRYLKPEFFDDEELCRLKPLTRLFFAGLWCWADREGRLKDQPVRLKNAILSYDKADGNRLLADLAGAGMISRYVVDGQGYIQIRHFLRHQKPHTRELPSTYPAQPKHDLKHDLGSGSGRAGTPQGTDTDKEQIREQIQERAVTVFRALENVLGLLTKPVADAVNAELDAGTDPEWIVAAANEAALNGVAKWNYIAAILKTWRERGRTNSGAKQGTVRQGHGRHLGASQRVAGAGVDWDAAEREHAALIASANGGTPGLPAVEVGQDV